MGAEVVPRSPFKQRCNLAMALLAGIRCRGFVVPKSELEVGALRFRSSSTKGWFPRIPADISAVRRRNPERCTSVATARIDVGPPVEDRLDEFPGRFLASPRRRVGFPFRGYVSPGHGGT